MQMAMHAWINGWGRLSKGTQRIIADPWQLPMAYWKRAEVSSFQRQRRNLHQDAQSSYLQQAQGLNLHCKPQRGVLLVWINEQQLWFEFLLAWTPGNWFIAWDSGLTHSDSLINATLVKPHIHSLYIMFRVQSFLYWHFEANDSDGSIALESGLTDPVLSPIHCYTRWDPLHNDLGTLFSARLNPNRQAILAIDFIS